MIFVFMELYSEIRRQKWRQQGAHLVNPSGKRRLTFFINCTLYILRPINRTLFDVRALCCLRCTTRAALLTRLSAAELAEIGRDFTYCKHWG